MHPFLSENTGFFQINITKKPKGEKSAMEAVKEGREGILPADPADGR
jgi:hypothetical protein